MYNLYQFISPLFGNRSGIETRLQNAVFHLLRNRHKIERLYKLNCTYFINKSQFFLPGGNLIYSNKFRNNRLVLRLRQNLALENRMQEPGGLGGGGVGCCDWKDGRTAGSERGAACLHRQTAGQAG